MRIIKGRIIFIFSISVNIVLAWHLFSVHQENNSMKQGMIIQYALQQEEALRELERALDHQDDKEEFVKALTSAYGIIYQIEMLTRDALPGSKVMEFPENINRINQSYQSKAVGYSLFNRAMDRSNEESIQELKLYTSHVSQVVSKLDYQNRIKARSLKAQYQVLNEVNNLINEFDLGK